MTTTGDGRTGSRRVSRDDRAREDRPAGKGRPTPKRSATTPGHRRGPVATPPATRKEAFRRTRQDAKTLRRLRAEGLSRGDEAWMLDRDRGPVRRDLRDLVDGRRGVLEMFFPNIVVYFLLTLLTALGAPQGLVSALGFVWLSLFLAQFLDAVLLSRHVAEVVARHGGGGRLRHTWYAISRALMIRRWRRPHPQVPTPPLLPLPQRRPRTADPAE